MIILLLYICRSTHFHIRNIGKIKNLLSYDACSTIIHALISCRLDYCNSILYNVPKSKTDRLQRLQNQCARILTKSPRREHITPVLMKLHWLKIQDRIIIKCWCLHINHFTIWHRLIYVNWLTKKKVMWILAWELIIISLLCHQLVRIVLTLFLSVHSFMLLHANGTNWVSISGHQILIVSGRVLKQCYLHNTMDADCKFIYYCYLWCDHCWLL